MRKLTLVYLLRQAFAVVFIGIVSAVFAISFASIVYTGELAPFFDRGIGLTLLGCAIMSFVGSFVLSYRGSIVQPQDVPAILISGGVAALVTQQQLTGEVLFATTASLVSVASLSMGVTAVLVGKLKLAMLARYIPYPVLAGFLAATGLLLLVGGIGVAAGLSPDFENLSRFFGSQALLKWIPVVAAGASIVLATRIFRGHLTLPLALLATAFGFYAIIAALGLSVEDAQNAGFLLGPFNNGNFLTGIGPQTISTADWEAILTQVPVIVTIVAISLVGTTLNASGLELELGRDLDINREVGGVGVANTLSAFVGGMPGYHLLGETILSGRLGLTGPIAGISGAVGCMVVLLFGGTILSVVPAGLIASVIAFLGIDLLYTWLWAERRNFKLRDYAIVVFIPVIAITFSFLMAIAAGLVVAFLFFIIAYARLDVIRSQNTVAMRRSFVERADSELEILSTVGRRSLIIELSGYLFFASANVLRERVRDLLDDRKEKTDWLILDFKHVNGIDISTWQMLQRLIGDCNKHNIQVLISGIEPIASAEKDAVSRNLTAERFKTLDQALEHVEDTLLANHVRSETARTSDMIEEVFALAPPGTFDGYVEKVVADDGDTVIERGSNSEDIYILQSGQLAVSVTQENGKSAIVALIRSGSVIGEMAYYTGRERMADIIADGPVQLMRIDMRFLSAMDEDYPSVSAAFHKVIARHMARRLHRTTMLLRDQGF